MSKTPLQPDPLKRSQAYYKIRIKGHLSPSWLASFEGMQLTHTPGGDTLLAGVVADQAALHGLLGRIRDLNLTLLSVTRVTPERSSRPGASGLK